MRSTKTAPLLPDHELANQIRSDIQRNEFKCAKYITDLSSRAEAAEALLVAIEQEWIWPLESKKQQYVFGYTERDRTKNMEEVCKAITHPQFAAGRDRSNEVLAHLYRNIDVELRSFRRALAKALGSISGEESVPELIFELGRDKRHVEDQSRYSSYDEFEAAVERWREMRRESLERFAASEVEDLESLIGKIDYLKQRFEHRYRQSAGEGLRFILRRDIIELLREKPRLLDTCLRFLLWKYSEIEDDVIIILSAAMPGRLERLQNIAQSDPDEAVRLRARAILAHLDGSFAKHLVPHGSFGSITHALAYYDSVLNSRGKAYKGYTWLEDETIEGMLHSALSRADERFSKDFVVDHDRHEQAHTADLLNNIRREFEPLSALIRKASERLASGPITIEFAYRDVQKEEKHWHADLAFLLNCFVQDKIVKRHAILVQSKKMNHNGAEFMFSWQVATQQCKDLINKSQSSYYFLYGPASTPTNRTLVVPASALFGVIEAMGMVGEKTVHFDKIKRVNRSLADFLLYDFIGCWVGDDRDEIVSFADGNATNDPPARYVVEVNIRQVTEQQ